MRVPLGKTRFHNFFQIYRPIKDIWAIQIWSSGVYFRPGYGQPKFTPFSKKTSVFKPFKINPTPTIIKIEISNLNHFFPETMGKSDLRGEAQF